MGATQQRTRRSGFTRFRFRGVSVTREGMYYFLVFVFILAGALIRNFQLLMVLACMLLGPAIFNAWSVYHSLKRIHITRRLANMVACDEPLFVELHARNSSRSAVQAVLVEDRVRQVAGIDLEGIHTVEVFFAKIPPRDVGVVSYRAVLRKRGKYQIGPLTASTAFPLGLMRSSRQGTDVKDVVVMPKTGIMTPNWRRMIQLERSGFASSRRRHGLLEGDFYGLREWRAGDPKQWIHWRTSAKQGQLVVRQFEQQNQQDFVLIVDPWLQPEATSADKQAAEHLISMAATVVQDLAAIGGCQLHLVCCGESQDGIVGNVSQAFLVEAMSLLAVLVPTSTHPIGSTMTHVLRTSKPSARVIYLTTRDTDLSDTSLFAAAWNDTRLRTELGRVKTVSAARNELETYFYLPQHDSTAETEQ